jgi:hypothetical protein
VGFGALNGTENSVIESSAIHSMSQSGVNASANATFTSRQEPTSENDNQACTDWNMNYALTLGGDAVWRIDRATTVKTTSC